jgi:hypothetical protein
MNVKNQVKTSLAKASLWRHGDIGSLKVFQQKKPSQGSHQSYQ